MPAPYPKVEIGFDIVGTNAPFFTLDDPVKGVLDNTSYPVSGSIFYDVTDKVKAIATRRGKNRQLDQFDAGLANIVLDNNDRTFDPEYPNSPYFGQIIPKRAIQISSGGRRIFTGTIDDWNLNYNPGGYSEASAAASDAFALFNTQTLPSGTAVQQTSGERLNAILNLPDVDWPSDARTIETGQTTLGADVYQADGNVLSYLRLVADSEPGNLFMGADGHVVFTDRWANSNGNDVMLTDDGSGIPYQGLKVVYGSELLYNEVVLKSDFAGEFVAQNETSIEQYGILNYTKSNLLTLDATYLSNLANYTTIKYGQPEYRFESLEVVMDDITAVQQDKILGLEIADYVTISFTPNGIAPAIVKIAEVIRIDHDISNAAHIVSLGFATVDKGFWTLSDGIFGKLSSGNVLGF